MMTFCVLPSPFATPLESEATGTSRNVGETVDELVQMLLTYDAQIAVEHLQALRAKGVTLRDMYLDLLAPAARLLGNMWEEDEANFAEVTIGVSRLHQILLQFSPVFCANATEHARPGHTAAIFALPGATHTFGVFMVVEFFRRAGWNVYRGSLGNDADVRQLLTAHDVDLLGISVSAEKHLDGLAKRIARLRKASRNPNVQILCGGPVLVHNPELIDTVGADGFAADGREAVSVAQALMETE